MRIKWAQTAAAFFLAAALALGAASSEAADPIPAKAEEKASVGHLALEEFRLGGVSPGIREEDIRQIFGKPIYGDCEIMVFSNGLVAEFCDEHPSTIEELVVAKPGTSVMSAAGLTAGMEEARIVRRYGRPDERDETPLHTSYTYYSTDGTMKLKFTVKDGVILKIKCALTD